MEIALDNSGRRVRALTARRKFDYSCPECQSHVTLVQGGVQVAHFRHAPRTAAERRRTKRCSLYAADQGGGVGGNYISKSEKLHPPIPRLGFAWIPNGGASLWGLLVSIPKPAEEVASVQVEGNVNGSVNLSREMIISRLPVWVKASSKRYKIRAYSRTGQPLLKAVPTGETERLDDRRVNLFHAGVAGGLQLAPEEPVIRGKSYFSLAKRSFWSSPSARLVKQFSAATFCDPAQEWVGHLVYFPLSPDEGVGRWVDQFCQREIQNRPATIDLVAPAAAISFDATNVISSEQDILVVARGDSWQHPTFEVASGDEAEEPIEWAIEGIEDRMSLCLSGLPAGEFLIHLRDRNLATLRVLRERLRIPTIAEVTLRTASLSDGQEIELPLHSSDTSVRWAGLFEGTDTWRHITIPNGISLTLSWRTSGSAEQIRVGLATADAIADALGDCLSARPTWASLDAGAFGRVQWQGPIVKQTEERRFKSLPRTLIHKIEWLLLAPKEVLPSARSPLGIQLLSDKVDYLSESNRELVKKLLNVSAWPASSLAHARDAVREIIRCM